MHVLIPDDPVLAASFLSLEQPLLFSLHYYYRAELTNAQATTVGMAYKSWGELQQMLPGRFRGLPTDVWGSEEESYILEGVGRQRLTHLHAVDAGLRVSHLEACYMMLRRAQLDSLHGPLEPLADILVEIDEGIDLVDRYRRVLQILYLPSPPQLLAAIRRVTPRGPVTAVALNAEQEREYRSHCEKVIEILSGDDSFAYATHRALYAM
ncbi:hypothetical protein ACH5A3_43905 [Streptomyces echinatus]|uniref:hypothetical protein n=1 Tax=Streptomyces echinatus TaxID=67293 RepID=UPI003796ED95